MEKFQSNMITIGSWEDWKEGKFERKKQQYCQPNLHHNCKIPEKSLVSVKIQIESGGRVLWESSIGFQSIILRCMFIRWEAYWCGTPYNTCCMRVYFSFYNRIIIYAGNLKTKSYYFINLIKIIIKFIFILFSSYSPPLLYCGVYICVCVCEWGGVKMLASKKEDGLLRWRNNCHAGGHKNLPWIPLHGFTWMGKGMCPHACVIDAWVIVWVHHCMIILWQVVVKKKKKERLLVYLARSTLPY